MKFSRMIGKAKLSVIKNSPELLLVGGIVVGAVSVFLACKETLKVEEIIEEHKDKIEKIHEGSELIANGTLSEEDYSVMDVKKDMTVTYVQTGLQLAKNYAPAIITGSLSLAAILTSHGIMRKRYLALGAAYTALDTTFKAYRERVRTEAGEALDRHYLYGTKIEEVVEEYEDEKGRKKTKVEKIETVDGKNLYSPFAKIFDETNPNWERDNERNRFFLAQVQSACQNKLRRDGYLWLNEVYHRLGFPETAAGQQFGWIFDDLSGESDSFVDFGIFNTSIAKNGEFINGYENSIILDFNCVNIINDVPIETV